MELFDNAFRQIRNTHVIPRVSYGITRKKVKYWSLKEVITTQLISLNKLSGKAVEIELNPDDYFKAIQCEIELFMNKSIIQYLDINAQKSVSKTWSFVTFYYFAFFSATCLFRLLDKGFIFLSREHTKNLEDFSLAVYSNIISLDVGNYYFNLKEINSYGNIILTVSNKGDSVHKSTWIQLEQTLRDLKQISNDSEKVVYELLIEHFSKFKTEYPSYLRNKLNYNGDSSLLDFENLLPQIEIQEIDKSFFKDLAKFDTNNLTETNQMQSISYLASYLFELNKKLYNEYLDRSNYGKDFNKERQDYIKQRK